VEVADPGKAPPPVRAARSGLKLDIGAALPIVTVFAWLCLLYGWEAWGSFAPWLNSDEFERAQFSRAVAATGHEAWRTIPYPFDSLYVYLLAPVWWIHDTGQAYGLAKGIGVALMTAVAFPAYGLARILVSRGWALFVAAGAAMIPALAYSSMLLLEPLAYPWTVLCFFLVVQALVKRRPAWVVGAALACLVAPFVRHQLFVVPAGAALAAALFWFTGSGGTRLRRNWRLRHWVAFAGLLALAAVVTGVVARHYSHVWALTTGTYPGDMVRFALRSFGSLTIGLGVLPVIAGLVALKRSRGEPRSPQRRAFTSVFVAMLATFALYAAAKSAYVHSIGVTEFVERNLIYLAPLFFTGTALVFERRRPALVAVLASTAFVLFLVVTTPYHMDVSAFFDAPGLAVLSAFGRDFGLGPGGAKALLIMLALASAALLLFLRSGSRSAARTVTVVAAVVVLAWNAYGEISFAHAAHKVASGELDNMPRPLDWIDRAVPANANVTYLGQSIDDPYDVLQLEFWNRRVTRVWSSDASQPGPPVVPDFTASDGQLEPAAGTEYMVADSGITPVGRVIARKKHFGGRGARTWTLVKLTPPLRLRQTVDGVYPDGWGAPKTALNQFSFGGNAPRTIKVHVFRTGAARRYPATVRVTLGSLVLAGPTGARKPSIQNVIATKTIRVPNELDHTFEFAAPPPPFRVETWVTPFPHDRNPIIGDPRDLGANIEYSVTPAS
jgi:hypothetical protein